MTTLSRLLYSLLFYLAQPLIWWRLLRRARRQPEYLEHLAERYGYYPSRPQPPIIWLHAVSLGETRAAAPLIARLLEAYPQHRILLTHMTPTGRAAGRELQLCADGKLMQAYLPYDLPAACRRFLDHFKPEFGLLMETEIWPNLMAAAVSRKIPVALINARLSARSQRAYQRIHSLIRPACASLSAVAAQTSADAERLRTIGARKVHVSGNLKFDVTPSQPLIQKGKRWREALGSRPVWLVASTREGEEALILDALAERSSPELLLVIVPRHPQRFDEVAQQVSARGMRYCRRSDCENVSPCTQVWLGDSMGEMPAYYALADIALIGGTLLPFGGQNLIEAAACGCPILVGPHTFNFSQATEDALASGAARRVEDAWAAAAAAEQAIRNPQMLEAMRTAATAFSTAHRGATERVLCLTEEIRGLRTTD